MPRANRQVFLNVPFDERYRKLLDALVFAVHECGLQARSALDGDDGGEIRLEKLYRIIAECRFGIHDLSRTTLDSENRLPRFNMPLELGLFLGARRFGQGAQRKKSCLILEKERWRYQKYCSDIAGQDIRAHGNQVHQALKAVRNWLQANLPASHHLPSPSMLTERYLAFRRELPAICHQLDLSPRELTFLDYRKVVTEWLAQYPA